MDESFDSEDVKSQAKKIIKSIDDHSPSKRIWESGDVIFSSLIEQGVIFLTVTDRSFPRFVAFEYLKELASSFTLEFGPSVPMFNRPFAAVSFDTTMEKIRRRFMDPQAQGSAAMQRLSSNLNEIHGIMCHNINDIMHRGEVMSEVERRSQRMLQDSRSFKKNAKMVNIMSMVKAWGPIAAVILVVIIVLYLRFK